MDIIKLFVDYSTHFISTGGIIYGFFIVFIECIIPMLPLGVFVALNVNAFGLIIGILISWAATCLGSFLVYILFTFIEKKYIKKIVNKKTINKILNAIQKFQKISFPELVLLITLPFTPSCFINIISGLARVPKKKFVFSIIIGKIFTVIFWGYIGKNFIESMHDPKSIIFILITLLIAYIISKIVSKKMNIE